MQKTYWFVIMLMAIIGLAVLLMQTKDSDSVSVEKANYDAFGTCLAEAGAKFYGAFWCPHCQDQKELFRAAETIPYVECSTPDGEGQTQICIDEKITGYPTWKFSDGTILNGTQQLVNLANKTNCPLP